MEAAPTAIPTIQALRIAYSPATRPALAALEQCAEDQPELAMLADEKPVTLMETSPADLWLRLGTPDNWGGFAAQLAEEQVVLIVHPENPVQSMNLEEVRGVFSGQHQSWTQVGGPDLPIRLWVLPEADETRQISEQNLLAGVTISSQAYLAISPRLMLEAIANDPGAIGYLPSAWIDATVQPVTLPGSQQTALIEPLLTLSASEPQGPVGDFVACLQGGAGQDILSSHYTP